VKDSNGAMCQCIRRGKRGSREEENGGSGGGKNVVVVGGFLGDECGGGRVS